MSVRVKLYNKDVNEEEVEQNGSNGSTSNNSNNQQQTAANSRNYTQEYALVNAKIAELERRFNAEKQPLINQKTAIMQAAAKEGISLASANESMGYSYNLSTKLFESVVTTGKTDELINVINSTFDALPDLSYYMDKKGCTSLAKRMLSFLNDQHWNDGANHWNDVAEFVTNTINRANISLSTKEVSKFIGELANQLNGSSMFVWVFGNQTPTEVEEVVDEPVEEILPEEPEEVYSEPITPEDEEDLLGFAEPVEETPVPEYSEEEELPEETYVPTPITADDEAALAQYAEPYIEEEDWSLNEGKIINLFNRKRVKEKEFYLPPLPEEIPNEIVTVINDLANEVADDLLEEVNNEGKMIGPTVKEYFEYSFDEFWNAYWEYFTDRQEIYENGPFFDNRQEVELQNIWKAWGIKIVSIFAKAMLRR